MQEKRAYVDSVARANRVIYYALHESRLFNTFKSDPYSSNEIKCDHSVYMSKGNEIKWESQNGDVLARLPARHKHIDVLSSQFTWWEANTSVAS